MSEQWSLKPLDEICEILDKFRKPITKKDRVSGEYPYYGATGIVDYVDDYIFDEKLILVGEDGAKWKSGDNTAFAVERKCWVNNHAHVIRPNRNIVLDNWLIYFLNMSDLTKHITGLTVPKLNQGKLRGILIPIPSLKEQKRIVRILDEAFENLNDAIKNAETTRNSVDELIETKLQTVFHEDSLEWKKIPFEESIVKVKSTPKIKKREFKETGQYPIISQEMDYVNGYWDDSSDLLTIQHPVVVFGDHTKTLKYIDFNFVRGADGLKVLQPREFLLPKFFYYQLKSLKLETLGYARHYRLLKQAIIRYPNMEQQQQIISMFDELNEQASQIKGLYGREMQSLDELELSILREAFSGELTGGIAA